MTDIAHFPRPGQNYPYERQWNIRTTAEGWIGRFGPIFLQNVNFIYVLVVQKNFGAFSRCSCPLNWSFFRGGAFFQNWGAGPSILEMGSFTNAFSLAPSFELFHWICCMISHCLWSIYIRLCSFHFSDTNMTTFTWIGIFIIWIDSLSRSQMALL